MAYQKNYLKLSHTPMNLSRQDASFKYPYDYILDHNFFEQKSGRFGRNSKILSSSSLNFTLVFILLLFDLMNTHKVRILPPFWTFL